MTYNNMTYYYFQTTTNNHNNHNNHNNIKISNENELK